MNTVKIAVGVAIGVLLAAIVISAAPGIAYGLGYAAGTLWFSGALGWIVIAAIVIGGVLLATRKKPT